MQRSSHTKVVDSDAVANEKDKDPTQVTAAERGTSPRQDGIDDILSITVWPLIISLPLSLTTAESYQSLFPSGWYDATAKDFWNATERPSPLGLSLGILAVVIGQLFTLAYFVYRKIKHGRGLTSVQKSGAPEYNLWEGVVTHLAQPEGFVMLGGYLIGKRLHMVLLFYYCFLFWCHTGTWMLGLMPKSYYSFSGGINWMHVTAQLLVQDFIQYLMHLLEHMSHPYIYKMSHKPHHRFTVLDSNFLIYHYIIHDLNRIPLITQNPKMFDAFNGSVTDTFLMILIPLILTARIVPANVWSYMTFGSLYANWLTLIHAEYPHPWDALFRRIGLGTAADHHVHHKLFRYNYGHTFM